MSYQVIIRYWNAPSFTFQCSFPIRMALEWKCSYIIVWRIDPIFSMSLQYHLSVVMALNDYTYHLVIVFYPFHRGILFINFFLKWTCNQIVNEHWERRPCYAQMCQCKWCCILSCWQWHGTVSANMQHLQAECTFTGFLMVKKSNCKNLLAHELRKRSLQCLFGLLWYATTKLALLQF